MHSKKNGYNSLVGYYSIQVEGMQITWKTCWRAGFSVNMDLKMSGLLSMFWTMGEFIICLMASGLFRSCWALAIPGRPPSPNGLVGGAC